MRTVAMTLLRIRKKIVFMGTSFPLPSSSCHERETKSETSSRPAPLLTQHSPLDTLHLSNAKMVFQSFFMLMTVQLFFFASSYSAWVKVPTLVLGSPCAGPDRKSTRLHSSHT